MIQTVTDEMSDFVTELCRQKAVEKSIRQPVIWSAL